MIWNENHAQMLKNAQVGEKKMLFIWIVAKIFVILQRSVE